MTILEEPSEQARKVLVALLREQAEDPREAMPAQVRRLLGALLALLAEDRGMRVRELPPDPGGQARRALVASGVHRAGHPVELLGQVYEGLLGFEVRGGGGTPVGLAPGEARRRSGAHYTSPALVREVVGAALAPLQLRDATSARLLALRVGDPSMGAGAFVVEACRQLAAQLASAWEREGQGADRRRDARRLVALRCVRGVDLDPIAVDLARWSLWLTVGDDALPLDFAAHTLRRGDALDGDALELALAGAGDDPPGFDALVGNPPWVSYAGRAAQPLESARRAALGERYRSFRGYRNLQGLFVERCARLLRPGGRLGLLLPSSMAELAGYAPVREEHDRYCLCDRELPDIGEDAFQGVFQPCMALLSTRRAGERADPSGAPWPLERPDLDPATRALLERLSGPPLPPHLFGERGLQTTSGDQAHLRPEPGGEHQVGLRGGSDVRPFALAAPSFYAAPGPLGGRLRSEGEWRRVRLLIRQTARVPIAALSDGGAFRNSLLAGFEDEQYPAAFLVAYLNSTPLRWAHYMRHRDARQGMPQLKISHLRALPAPPDPGLAARLAPLGERLSSLNRGLQPDEQRLIDQAVAEAFRLSPDELAAMLRQAPSV